VPVPDVRLHTLAAMYHPRKVTPATIEFVDPLVTGLQGAHFAESLVALMRDADALVILTEWDEFQTVSLGELRTTMRGRVVVDARNLLDPEAVRRHGFTYLGVGR